MCWLRSCWRRQLGSYVAVAPTIAGCGRLAQGVCGREVVYEDTTGGNGICVSNEADRPRRHQHAGRCGRSRTGLFMRSLPWKPDVSHVV